MTTTRSILVAAALLVGSFGPGAIFAQQSGGPSQEELVKKRDEKLKAPFLSKATWITDYATARETAKKKGQLIFGYFTRSYAK